VPGRLPGRFSRRLLAGRLGFVSAALASVGAAVGVATVSSCLSTTGLSAATDTLDGGDPSDTALPVPNPCGKDLKNDTGNCGGCGTVCSFGVNSFPRCDVGKCKIGCNSGFGSCDGDETNGCETNLQTVAASCGACARSCLGGTCAAGVCQATVIATVPTRLAGITVNATNVFYGSNGAVAGSNGITRIDKDGKNPLPIVASQTRAIYGIASDASFVYLPVANQQSPAPYDGSILKVAKDGIGGLQVVASNLSISPAFNLVITADFAYWSNFGTFDSGSGTYLGSVVRCALPAGCGASPSSLAGTQDGPYGVAVDGTSVFFGTNGGGTSGNAYKCPLAGCGAATPTKISPTSQIPYWMAADAANVYWATATTVVKSDQTKMDAVPMASGIAARSLLVDAKNVYWVNSAGGLVQSCAIEGCNGTPTNIASGLSCPGYLAQDSEALYWTTGSGCGQPSGTIMRVRK
jgi:hypothetical protein